MSCGLSKNMTALNLRSYFFPWPLIFLLLLPLFLYFFASPREVKMTSIIQVKPHFQAPPVEFRPVPFWVWNEDMTAEKIKEQLVDFKEKGFGGVFIHPRPGLITPYLSSQWLTLFKQAVDLGRQLGLKIWIYDENSYPSGFAGGLVPAAKPEAVSLGLKAKQLSKIDLAEALSDDTVGLWKKEGERFVDIIPAIRGGQRDWPEGVYWQFQLLRPRPSAWYGGFTYVDLMQPGVTEAFLYFTHETYRQICGDEFGQTIPGTFQDEAHIGPPGDSDAVNFTPALLAEFPRRRGYDLKVNLPLLFEEQGDFHRVRHDFYLTLLELFIDNWAKPYYQYCTEHGLQLTGHYWEHDWPRPRLVPDNMALYAYAHIPGIDILMNEWSLSPNAQFGNARAVKEIVSVANQLGRQRTLSETYGASGWGLTFFDQKRIGDWEYALGVNFLNQHLCFSTIVGARKRDHPLSFSYHEPWWPAYRLLNDYFARLSLVLSAGVQKNRILIIEPTTSAWMYYSPARKNERWEKLASDFQNFIHNLEKLQVEYDLASEFILKDYGQIEGKKLRVGQSDYELIILPCGLENLEPWTASLLKDFLKAGGHVFSWAEKEIREAGKISSLAEEFRKYKSFRNLAGQPIDISIFLDILPPAIEFKNLQGEEKLFHHRRQMSDGQFLFLANIKENEVASGEVWVKGEMAEKWDPFTAEFQDYPSKKVGRQMVISFCLNPGESLLLAIYEQESRQPSGEGEEKMENKAKLAPEASAQREKGGEGEISRGEAKSEVQDLLNQKTRENKTPVELRPTNIRRLDPNVLVIDYGDLILGGKREKDLYFYEAQKKSYLFHGWQGNPWDSAVQFKDTLIARNKFSPESGFRAEFFFPVGQGVKREALKLAVERPAIFQVLVNGIKLEALPNSWWLDKNIGLFDLGEVTQEGTNIITLVVKPFNLLAELEPIYVLGDFSVEAAEKGFMLQAERPLELGPWKNQGLPFYGHRVLYQAELELASSDLAAADYYFLVPDWQGALAQLKINGQTAGYLFSRYDWLKITDKLNPGKNSMELIIFGTLRNTLGPHHLNPPPGRAWPSAFQQAPAGGQPPGDEYSFLDYGLFSPFQINIIKK